MKKLSEEQAKERLMHMMAIERSLQRLENFCDLDVPGVIIKSEVTNLRKKLRRSGVNWF